MKHISKIKHNCPHPRSYSSRYDSYFCEKCDRWIEGKCGDPDCQLCTSRPEKPSLEEKKTGGIAN